MKKRQTFFSPGIRFFHSRKGFTFFEVVMVVVIVGVLSGVVRIEYAEANRKARISNATFQALADLRSAQAMAMTYRRQVDFIVDVTNNTYTAEWNTGGTLQSSTQPGDLFVDFDDIPDVSMTLGISSTLSFDAFGHPSLGGASFEDELPVFRINEDVYLLVLPSGYSYINDELTDMSEGCGGGSGC